MHGWIELDDADRLILRLLALGVALVVAWVALFALPALMLAHRLSPEADRPRWRWFGWSLLAATAAGGAAGDAWAWAAIPIAWCAFLAWRVRVVGSRQDVLGSSPRAARPPWVGGAPPPPPPPPPPPR